jgi:hypothetical protein
MADPRGGSTEMQFAMPSMARKVISRRVLTIPGEPPFHRLLASSF